MTPDQIRSSILDRFGRWGRFLEDQDATPTVIVGLGWPGRRRDDYQILLTCPREMTDDQVIEQLLAAVTLIRAGRADHR